MTITCKMYIQRLQTLYPGSWKTKALEHIDKLINFYEEYPKLALIEMLSEFYSNRESAEFHNRFQDVFAKYEQTHFLVKNLAAEDHEYLMQRYLQEFGKYRKEILNVVS